MALRFVGGKTTNSVGKVLLTSCHEMWSDDDWWCLLHTEDGRNIQGVGMNNQDGKAGGIYAEGFLIFCCIILAMQYKVLPSC